MMAGQPARAISLQAQLEALDIQIEVNEVELENLPEGHQDALHAAFATLEASRWQPIETALDYRVLGAIAGQAPTTICVKHRGRYMPEWAWIKLQETRNSGEYKEPTHWRPLPPPPDREPEA